MTISELQAKSIEIRQDIIRMISDASSGHPGGSLSAVEVLVTLYNLKMRIFPTDPENPDRDRFVLSKGHAAPAYYAVLGDMGYFDKSEYKQFRQLHCILQGHPDANKCPGVDASTGSLGQGLSTAVGMALGAKLSQKDIHVFTLCGDGELQEGLVWEASMAAAHYRLDNLTVIIDNNGLQIDGANNEVMDLGNLRAKFISFGYHVIELEDGHDIEAIQQALEEPVYGQPKMIICHTVKGKGVSFMENQVGWHGKAPDAEETILALKELEELSYE